MNNTETCDTAQHPSLCIYTSSSDIEFTILDENDSLIVTDTTSIDIPSCHYLQTNSYKLKWNTKVKQVSVQQSICTSEEITKVILD